MHAALEDPLGIAYADTRLFIADGRRPRVHAYSTAGERDPDAEFRLVPGNDSPRGVAYGNARLHVVDIFQDKARAWWPAPPAAPPGTNDFGHTRFRSHTA